MNSTPDQTMDSSSFHIWNNINIFFGLCSLLANISVLALCLENVRQHSYAWFIGSLALADTLTTLQIIILSRPAWLENDTICRLVPATGIISVGAAIGSHPLLGFNRYIAMEKSRLYPKL